MLIERIEQLRRELKWAVRHTHELGTEGVRVWCAADLGLNRRRFLDPTGESNRAPRRIIAC